MTIQFKNGFATENRSINVHCIDEQNIYTGSAQFVTRKGFGLPPGVFLEGPEITAGDGQAIQRQENSWVLVADYRGETIYDKTTGKASMVDFLGEIPVTHTTEPKPDEFHIWEDSGWMLDVEKQQQAAQENRKQEKERLLTLATEQMAILQDAVELEIATDQEVEQLQAWKKYRVALNRLNPAQTDISFPQIPMA